MSSTSLNPIEAKQSDKPYLSARAAELKEQIQQQLKQRRVQAASVQPADMSSSEGLPGQCKQQKQPDSDEIEPVQTKESALAQAQSIPGLSHQTPDDRDTHEGTSQSKIPPDLNAPDQVDANDKVQGSPDIYEKLMEKLSSPTRSKTTGKDANGAAMTTNEVGRDIDAPSSTNAHAAATSQEKPDNRARDKAQRGDDGTAIKEAPASLSDTKSTVVPKEKASTAVTKEKSSTLSSTEEGEIKSSPPTRRIPVQESTPQPASSRNKRTPPIRAATATTIVPTEPRAERNASSRSRETKPPVPKLKEEAKGDTVPARPSASRPDGKRGHGRRASHHARQGRQGDDNNHTTREPHKAPPPPSSFPHHVYVRPGREQHPRSSSPAAPRPIEYRERELESVDFRDRDRDLCDWLRLTGWDSRDYRLGELARMRRQEQIDRESAELKAEGEREKARLKRGFAEGSRAGHAPAPPRRADGLEPAGYSMLGPYAVTGGIKRERGEESDGGADGRSPAKYPRTNSSHNGSRAGYQGYHDDVREDSRQRQAQEDRRRSGNLSPPRGFPDRPPSRSHSQHYSRQHFRSPAGHPLPRDEFNGKREVDRYMTPPHPLPRPGSPPPRGRGYDSSRFHESEYGRLAGRPG